MNFKTLIGAGLAAGALTVSSIGAANAIVTFTPADGGFAGKGDVQTAFGWKNSTMQANHTAISFRYEATTEYSFECEWWTGPERNRTYHKTPATVEYEIAAAVVSESRKTGQWTGWTLAATALPSGSTSEPTDSDCGAEGNQMKSIVAGSIVLEESTGGGLYAIFGDDEKLLALYTAPPAV